MRPKTIPNLVTVLGIVLTVLYVWTYLGSGGAYAFSLFIAAGLTDLLDGFLARWLNQCSPLGAYLDVIRDRALGLATLGHLLVIFGVDALWFVGTILLSELGVGFVNQRRGFPQPILLIGKLRTGFCALGALFIFASQTATKPFLSPEIQNTILGLMAGLSVAALIGYATRRPESAVPAELPELPWTV